MSVERPKSVICSACGASPGYAASCERCKGTGRVPFDDAFLAELNRPNRVICVSGAEVEALLKEIQYLRATHER